MSTPLLPLYLKDYLEDRIAHHEFVEVTNQNILQTICLVDPQEHYCHVDFPAKDNPIPRPRLYHKKDWLSSMIRRERLKEDLAKDRAILNEICDAEMTVRKHMIDLFAFNPDNKVHKERLDKLVKQAMESKAKGLSEFLGVDLVNLPQPGYKVKRLKAQQQHNKGQ